MSSKSTALDDRYSGYIASHTSGDDDFLRQLKIDAQAAGIPRIEIAPEQASFMQILLKTAGAKTVVEVGTLAGYSAINMARALPRDGKVISIEVNPKHAEFARRKAEASDVAANVDIRLGDGRQILEALPDSSADAAFLDADKVSYPYYLEQCLRIVRKGGMILVDNAFAFGQLFEANPKDREAPAIIAFNESVAREKRLHGVIVPLGDGLWVCSIK